ncbi:hypothetical protein JDV02_008592 [Purpureocillium takamizusanense]|uniref:Uncharacterized protein n=1 Tax=Purpureocillium takamizusanense TaxID=2060973 RepID=A0A9Q8VFB7_9HYPO|nr:uncharacterized protein JDV02_008592 [Purpureocillium takamizusanense]UNI22729.1 hypothetical protein JDV02_008592 [Purpureocillium takamizusanense]
MEHLIPDDPAGLYQPLLCPNCHKHLPGSQEKGYLCDSSMNWFLPQGTKFCIGWVPAPKKLMFVEAALGNCAGRCKARLTDTERKNHTIVCSFCVRRYEPVVRSLIRLASERKTARAVPVSRGKGAAVAEAKCGNPQCNNVVPEEELYSFPNEYQHDLAEICPACFVTATLVLLEASSH